VEERMWGRRGEERKERVERKGGEEEERWWGKQLRGSFRTGTAKYFLTGTESNFLKD